MTCTTIIPPSTTISTYPPLAEIASVNNYYLRSLLSISVSFVYSTTGRCLYISSPLLSPKGMKWTFCLIIIMDKIERLNLLIMTMMIMMNQSLISYF